MLASSARAPISFAPALTSCLYSCSALVPWGMWLAFPQCLYAFAFTGSELERQPISRIASIVRPHSKRAGTEATVVALVPTSEPR